MTDNERAKTIRQELKTKLGASSRDISVTAKDSIRVKIKKEGFSFSDVQEIAEKQENYERCERSGEILQGGNTFVFTDFDYTLEKTVEERICESVENVFNRFKNDDENSSSSFEIEGVEFAMHKYNHIFILFQGDRRREFSNSHFSAMNSVIARMILSK